MKNYRPLPDCLTIKNSEIEGLGLFATKDIPAGTDLGVSHIVGIMSQPIRTPLGGFYNHSEEPNAYKYKSKALVYSVGSWVNVYALVTIRDIKAGEEITVTYTLYKID